MNKEEYLKYHEDSCKKMVEITKKKNADYTGTGSDPFANFSRVESMGACTTLQGFLVRILDKYSRLVSFSQRGYLLVADENFEDTCLDLANYAILLAGYVKSQKKENPENQPAIKDTNVCARSGHSFIPDPKESYLLYCRFCLIKTTKENS